MTPKNTITSLRAETRALQRAWDELQRLARTTGTPKISHALVQTAEATLRATRNAIRFLETHEPDETKAALVALGVDYSARTRRLFAEMARGARPARPRVVSVRVVS